MENITNPPAATPNNEPQKEAPQDSGSKEEVEVGIPPKNVTLGVSLFCAGVGLLLLCIYAPKMLQFNAKEGKELSNMQPVIAQDAPSDIRGRYDDLPPPPPPTKAPLAPQEGGALHAARGSKIHQALADFELSSFEKAHQALVSNGVHYRISPEEKERRVKATHPNHTRKSHCVLPPGTLMPFTVQSAIHTNHDAPILALTNKDVFDVKGNVAVPRGSKIVGRYGSNISFGDERVSITWNTLVAPSGTHVSLQDAVGVDGAGRGGIPGEVYNHWGKLAGAIVLSTVLSSGVRVANSGEIRRRRFSDYALEGAASDLNQTGQKIIDRQLDIPPTILVEVGEQGHVFLESELHLEGFSRCI